MLGDDPLELPFRNDVGGRTKPIYTHELKEGHQERLKQLEDGIRENVAFRGLWRSYVDADRWLPVPESYIPILKDGGIVTTSTEKHLLLFSKRHWERMEKIISDYVGLNPDRVAIARHIYAHSVEFKELKNGMIQLSPQLVRYANIKKEVAIIGLVYYAEIHAKADYYDVHLEPEAIAKLARAFK